MSPQTKERMLTKTESEVCMHIDRVEGDAHKKEKCSVLRGGSSWLPTLPIVDREESGACKITDTGLAKWPHVRLTVLAPARTHRVEAIP